MPLKLMVMNRLHNISINGAAPPKVVLTSCWKHFSITRLTGDVFEDYDSHQLWAKFMLDKCKFVYVVPDDVGFSYCVWLITNINSSLGQAMHFMYITGICEPSQLYY